MVLQAIIHALATVFVWVMHQMPQADTSGIQSAIGYASNVVAVVSALDLYFPMSTGLICLGIYMSIYAALHGANLIRRLYSAVSGGGGA